MTAYPCSMFARGGGQWPRRRSRRRGPQFLAGLLFGLLVCLDAGLIREAIAATAGPEASDQAAGSVSGWIFDQTGRVLVGVVVTLSPTDRTQPYIASTSDRTGMFELQPVPAGTYRLDAALPGFATLSTRISIGDSVHVREDLILQVRAIEYVVTVTEHRAFTAPPPPWPRPRDPGLCADAAAAGCLTAPSRTKSVDAGYPALLFHAGLEGSVKIRGTVDRTGSISEFDAVNATHQAFADAAVDAVREWKFQAARLNETAIDTPIQVTFHFRRCESLGPASPLCEP